VLLESVEDQKVYIRECKVGQKPGVGGPRSRGPITESQNGGGAGQPNLVAGALSILRRS